MLHAIIGCIGGKIGFLKFLDPLAIYYGGYRYNQPSHLMHMALMVHSFAYFVFDSIIEVIYGTDDILTNIHHVCVVSMSYFHIKGQYGGFEYMGNIHLLIYIVLHLMAEVSNPFLILRTILKIKGMRNSTLYMLNDIAFAGIFILVRMILSPLCLVYLMEGDKILLASKFGL